MSGSILEFKNISKSYSGNRVLHDINIVIKKGEIHALVGENGAGKSTLMNILFGMPVIHSTGGFRGSIYIDGKPVTINSPFEAMAYGIGMVHQEFMLIPEFTVAENIKLNRETPKNTLLNRFTGRVFGKRMQTLDIRKMTRDARRALDRLEIGIEEYVAVCGLPVGHMQMIEIAREIDKENIRLLVLDEPTAVLTESETENLLEVIRKLAAEGIAIIFISHRLAEIIDVADKVTILRDGRSVATKVVTDTSVSEIAELMIGRKVIIDRFVDAERILSDDVILRIKDLHVAMPGETVNGIDLEARRGEILGIGGLAGQGKLGIASGIMGLYPARGEVIFDGKSLMLGQTKEILAASIGFVSEDRKTAGLLLDESVESNIIFTELQINNGFLKSFRFFTTKVFSTVDRKAAHRHTNRMIASLDIRCASGKQQVGRLSGGNQQKVCMARALTQNPKLLFVSEPTRGIDIGAKKLILDLLLRLSNEQGMTIVVTSSELAELRGICDRIAIICEGKVTGILPPDASPAEFGLLMSGIRMQGKGQDGGMALLSCAELDVGKPGSNARDSGAISLSCAELDNAKPGSNARDSRTLPSSYYIRRAVRRLPIPTIIIGGLWVLILIFGAARGQSVSILLSDTVKRFGMWGLLVLSMVPSIKSGTGPNFALPIGIVSGLLALVVQIESGFAGVWLLIGAMALAVVFATILGFLYGKLMNAVKGSEMIVATYSGFAITYFFCILWMTIPFRNPIMGWMLGDGLRNTIELRQSGVAQIIDSFLSFNAFGINIPTGMLIFIAIACLLMWLFFRCKTGIAISSAGMNPMFAGANGVDVNKVRLTAGIISTICAAIGIIIYSQSFGFVSLYTAPLMMAFPAVACILIGGANVRRAKIIHVVIGTIIYQGLITNGPPVLNSLFPDTELSEIIRMIVQNGVILYALTLGGDRK